MATVRLSMHAVDGRGQGALAPERILALRAFRWVFYPLVVLSAAGAHLFFARGLDPSLHSLVTGGVSLVSLALFLLFERLVPYRAEWNLSRGDLTVDALQTNLVLPVVARLNEILLAGGVTWLAAHLHWSAIFPVHAPFALQVVLALLVAEFAYYWAHRLGHGVLWRFHAVHHGSERVYSLNAGRFQLVDAWLGTFAYLAPMLLLGVPAEIVAFIATLNAVTGFMEHVNIDFEAGLLNRIFNTAQLHRWHHAADLEVAFCNFGKVLTVWDHVFGTWYLPAKAHVGEVGVGPGEKPVPVTFWGQTLYPWRRGR